MPTYEFRCSNGHEFEQFHRRISDAPSTVECPECGATAERLVSGGAGLLFKGSGFYLTDYGKNAHRKSAPSGGDKGGDKGGDGAGGAKSDGGTKSDGAGSAGASGGASGGASSGTGGSAGGSAGGGSGSSGGSSSGAKGE